eukprot:GHVT01094827.1.p1 GENE.GHVT01094827.1~~GHVT01094827.1.p1  ORF type:complete len:118 (-),score=13.83 GHVT01094827.1:143-496(-)
MLFATEEKFTKHAPGTFLRKVGCTGIVDSLVLSHHLPWPDGKFQCHKLSHLYAQLTGRTMMNEHDALGDCKGMASIMDFEPFATAWRCQPIAMPLEDFIRRFSKQKQSTERRTPLPP